MDKDAKHWIDKLNLEEHPEGGYFVEAYRSERFVNLPKYDGPRNACSAIYYLLEGDQFSAFHKLKSDELNQVRLASLTDLSSVMSSRKISSGKLSS